MKFHVYHYMELPLRRCRPTPPHHTTPQPDLLTTPHPLCHATPNPPCHTFPLPVTCHHCTTLHSLLCTTPHCSAFLRTTSQWLPTASQWHPTTSHCSPNLSQSLYLYLFFSSPLLPLYLFTSQSLNPFLFLWTIDTSLFQTFYRVTFFGYLTFSMLILRVGQISINGMENTHCLSFVQPLPPPPPPHNVHLNFHWYGQ